METTYFDDIIKSGGIGLILRDFVDTHRGDKCIYLTDVFSAQQAECQSL